MALGKVKPLGREHVLSKRSHCFVQRFCSSELADGFGRVDPDVLLSWQVSYEDVERLKPLAHMENVRIPHFMQDQARYSQQLAKIMAVNQLTDEELRSII